MDFTSTKKQSFFKEVFNDLKLENSKIQTKEFEQCHFEKCTFIECEFFETSFIECSFHDCTLSAIKPTNSRFMNVIFKNCKVIGFDWTKALSIRFLEFYDSQLDYSDFSTLELHHLKLIHSQCHEVDFTQSDLSQSIFEDTDLEKAKFSNTNLTKANLKTAYNYAIDFHTNILKKTEFSLPEAASLLNSLDIVLSS